MKLKLILKLTDNPFDRESLVGHVEMTRTEMLNG